MESQQRSPQTTPDDADPMGDLGNDKPPIEQPGPIIIKGGGGGGGLAGSAVAPVDIESRFFLVLDDGGREGKHYLSKKPVRITSIRFTSDNGVEGTADFSESREVTIGVNIED